MSATAIAAEAAVARTHARRLSLIVAVVAGYALFVLALLPWTLVQDSWLTFVSGREIVHHGLPWHDHLAFWTHGATWIDQQWLAQLVFYGLAVVGGVKLALLFNAALLVGTMALAMWFARRAGASQEAVFMGAVAGAWLAPWGLQMRAQSLAAPLFVAVLGLLAADARAPSRRIFWVFPLLLLWANVHGTVALGAALVALRGALGPWRSRGVLLAAPLCLFASPYGPALAGYYRHMLVNPAMSRLVTEWKPSAPGALTAPFYIAAFAAVWLLGRRAGRTTWFERLALAGTLVAALSAMRSIVWFGLACVVILPRLVDGRSGKRRTVGVDAFWRWTALAAAGGATALLVVTAARPEAWFLRRWPAPAARAVAVAAAADRSAPVFADDRHSDWLLWTEPGLRGRIAYDIRFELLSPAQFAQLAAFRRRTGDDWRRAARGDRVLVFDPRYQSAALKAIVAGGRARVTYRDADIAVVVRS